MAEKRDNKRRPKRFSLRFGTDRPERIGFTEDVSPEGLFIKTSSSYLPNTRLMIELTVHEKGVVTMEGVVMWIKRVPPNLIHFVKKSGMGVKITRIVSGEDIYTGLFLS